MITWPRVAAAARPDRLLTLCGHHSDGLRHLRHAARLPTWCASWPPHLGSGLGPPYRPMALCPASPCCPPLTYSARAAAGRQKLAAGLSCVLVGARAGRRGWCSGAGAPGDPYGEARTTTANKAQVVARLENPLTWFLGLAFGCNNAMYYGVNAFLPDWLARVGRPDLIGPSFGWLNVCAAFRLVCPARYGRPAAPRAWPYLVFGPSPGRLAWHAAGATAPLPAGGRALVGFALAVTFVVTSRCRRCSARPTSPSLAGGMFTISYSCAVIIPILCGALWDLTGIPWTAFLPVGLCGHHLDGARLLLSVRARAGEGGSDGMALSVCRRPARGRLGRRSEVHRRLHAVGASVLTVAAMVASVGCWGSR